MPLLDDAGRFKSNARKMYLQGAAKSYLAYALGTTGLTKSFSFQVPVWAAR